MTESLAYLKTVLAIFLMLALAGASPVFATILMDLTVDPTEACPGGKVNLSAAMWSSSSVEFYYPDGLFEPGGFCYMLQAIESSQWVYVCQVIVLESACPGSYTITANSASGESISAKFDVPSSCCPPKLFPTPQAPVVGGVVIPPNTFALVAPWLAVIGFVGCISAAVVVARKRH